MFKKGLMVAALVGMLAAAPVMAAETADSGVVSAAETTAQETVIEWNDTMEQAFVDAGFSGSINSIEALGMEILIPDGLEQRQPTEEEKEKDDILVFENADKDQRIEFVLGPLGDCQDLDDVTALLNNTYPGMTVTPTRINEYSTLVFGNEEADSMTVLIPAGDAGFLRIICHPIMDPEMNQVFSYVAASIQQMK